MTDDGVRYESKAVKALRGTESRSVAKWQKLGWELVDQQPGTLHTTLNFRKRKPPLPTRQLVIGGAVALVLAAVVGIGALLGGGGDSTDALSANPAPAATEEAESPSATPTPARSESTTPTPVAPEPTSPPGPPAPIENTTVDNLLDRLNAANMGGVVNGDRFRVIAELMAPEYWGYGASGDYVVNLKAKSGANDLQVFVDESQAEQWQDGTRVEMVLEAVPATINGETTDGWLRVQSAEVIPAG